MDIKVEETVRKFMHHVLEFLGSIPPQYLTAITVLPANNKTKDTIGFVIYYTDKSGKEHAINPSVPGSVAAAFCVGAGFNCVFEKWVNGIVSALNPAVFEAIKFQSYKMPFSKD